MDIDEERRPMGHLILNEKHYKICKGLNTIGRNKSAQVILCNPNISQNHAIITVTNEKEHYLSEISSTNGTFIDNVKLKPFVLYPINDTSHIKLADVSLKYVTDKHDLQLTEDNSSLQQTQMCNILNMPDTQILKNDNSTILHVLPSTSSYVENKNISPNIHDMVTQIFPVDILHDQPTQVSIDISMKDLPRSNEDILTNITDENSNKSIDLLCNEITSVEVLSQIGPIRKKLKPIDTDSESNSGDIITDANRDSEEIYSQVVPTKRKARPIESDEESTDNEDIIKKIKLSNGVDSGSETDMETDIIEETILNETSYNDGSRRNVNQSTCFSSFNDSNMIPMAQINSIIQELDKSDNEEEDIIQNSQPVQNLLRNKFMKSQELHNEIAKQCIKEDDDNTTDRCTELLGQQIVDSNTNEISDAETQPLVTRYDFEESKGTYCSTSTSNNMDKDEHTATPTTTNNIDECVTQPLLMLDDTGDSTCTEDSFSNHNDKDSTNATNEQTTSTEKIKYLEVDDDDATQPFALVNNIEGNDNSNSSLSDNSCRNTGADCNQTIGVTEENISYSNIETQPIGMLQEKNEEDDEDRTQLMAVDTTENVEYDENETQPLVTFSDIEHDPAIDDYSSHTCNNDKIEEDVTNDIVIKSEVNRTELTEDLFNMPTQVLTNSETVPRRMPPMLDKDINENCSTNSENIFQLCTQVLNQNENEFKFKTPKLTLRKNRENVGVTSNNREKGLHNDVKSDSEEDDIFMVSTQILSCSYGGKTNEMQTHGNIKEMELVVDDTSNEESCDNDDIFLQPTQAISSFQGKKTLQGNNRNAEKETSSLLHERVEEDDDKNVDYKIREDEIFMEATQVVTPVNVTVYKEQPSCSKNNNDDIEEVSDNDAIFLEPTQAISDERNLESCFKNLKDINTKTTSKTKKVRFLKKVNGTKNKTNSKEVTKKTKSKKTTFAATPTIESQLEVMFASQQPVDTSSNRPINPIANILKDIRTQDQNTPTTSHENPITIETMEELCRKDDETKSSNETTNNRRITRSRRNNSKTLSNEIELKTTEQTKLRERTKKLNHHESDCNTEPEYVENNNSNRFASNLKEKNNLGNDESNLNKTQLKGTGSRNQKHRVAFTRISDNKLEKKVKDMGGTVCEEISNCTVLIAENLLRTRKVLEAINNSKPICKKEWILDSENVGKFLDPWDYLVEDKEAEEKYNFSLKESLRSDAKKKLFESYKFQIATGTDNKDVLRAIIESGCGKCVNRAPVDKTNFYVISGKSKPNKSQYKTIDSEEIFASILKQEINFRSTSTLK